MTLPQEDRSEVVDGDVRTLRVAVVDDHQVFVDSLVHLLGRQADLEVVGTGGSWAECVAGLPGWVPDVLVVDRSLPDADALARLGELAGTGVVTRVVVLTAHDSDAAREHALRHGADAYVVKTAGVGEVLAAVRGHALPGAAPDPQAPTARAGDALSSRELQVLELMADGTTNADIGERLDMRAPTVRNHVARISAKLGTHSKLEAVVEARRRGLLR